LQKIQYNTFQFLNIVEMFHPNTQGNCFPFHYLLSVTSSMKNMDSQFFYFHK